MEARQIEFARALPASGSDGLVPRDLIRVITDNLWSVILIASVIAGLATAYAYLSTPLYSADALVQVEKEQRKDIGDVIKQQQPTTQAAPTATEVSIIQSRAVLMPVIQKYKMDVSVTPHRFPVLGKLADSFATRGEPSRPWFGLSSYAWGGEVVDVSSISVPRLLEDRKLELAVLDGNRYELRDPSGKVLLQGMEGQLAQGNGVTMTVERLAARPGETFDLVRLNEVTAMNRFTSALKVSEIGKETGIVQVSYLNGDPALATQVVNALTQNYIDAHVTHNQEEASKMLAFINSELPRLRDELKSAEAQLSTYRTNSGSLTATTEGQSYLQGSIDFDRQIAALNLQRTQLLDRFTPQSPEVRTIDQQLSQLQNAKSRFDARFTALPTAERRSADLARDAKVSEDIYVAMVNKSHELSVSRAGTIGNVHIIDIAVQPSTPVKPQRALIVSAAIVLGMIVGVLWVVARRYLSASVSEPEQVEDRLRLPVFGAVLFSGEQARLDRNPPMPKLLTSSGEPAFNADRSHALATVPGELRPNGTTSGVPHVAALLAAAKPHDVTTEALRGIRTMLNSKLANAENRVVMLTGATPSTGKSFVAANLALLYAEAGKRVLLVDADLRRGRQAAYFGLPEVAGLADLLAGAVPAEQAIHPTSVPRLTLLPAGTRPRNPSELLSMPQMRQLLESFNDRFDLVLVDTPPVLAVTDATIVSGYAGATVLVLRENAQTETEIGETLKRLERAGAKVAGAVFNAMSTRRSDKRSYDYVYAYTRDAHAAA
jgi:tyrosine-protein kinase Etk/Wzc